MMNRTKTILLACILSCLLVFLPKALWAETADAGAAMSAVVEAPTAAAEPVAEAAPVAESASESVSSEPTETAPEPSQAAAEAEVDSPVTEATASEPDSAEDSVAEDAASEAEGTESPSLDEPLAGEGETAPVADTQEQTLPEETVPADDTETDPAIPAEGSAEEDTEDAVEEAPEIETDTDNPVEEPATSEADPVSGELAEGLLSTEELAAAPMQFGNAPLENAETDGTVYVTTFQQLQDAIAQAATDGTTVVKIVVRESFELTETLTIGKGKNIILTAENAAPKDDEDWTVENPGDYADAGEARQRDIIEASRQKGEEALDVTDLEKNPLPTEEDSIILKRAESFLGTIIRVIQGGKLTIGDATSALYLDGNAEKVRTSTSSGFMLDISGSGSEVHLENGVLMHSKNSRGYSAPVKVWDGASFTMSGGRISKNENAVSDYQRPTSAGAVYVERGGQFTMTGGSIDNNYGGTGGVFLGDLYGSVNAQDKSRYAKFDMTGGVIARNESGGYYGMGGGVTVFPKAIFDYVNGIIAGNESPRGGGIFVSDQYVTGFDGISYSDTNSKSYEDYLVDHKATLNMNGGLLYKNRADVSDSLGPNASGAGGGIYVDSDHANLNAGQLLDNYAGNMGGGVYVSIVPRTQTLKDILITENHAFSSSQIFQYAGGNGGGLWNCPVGIVHLEDGHSVYVFGNTASNYNSDLYLHAKRLTYRLNGERVGNTFYSTVSPLTKEGNLIPYEEAGPNGGIAEVMWHTQDGVSLRAIYDAILKDEAWRNAKFFVLGNEAQKGGGIGSNANIIGEGEPGDYEIEVRKKWDQSISQPPDSVQVDLYIGDVKYGEVELSPRNGWRAVFTNLPYTPEELQALGLRYSVKEHKDDFYVVVEETFQPAGEKILGALNLKRYISQLNKEGSYYDTASWFEFQNPWMFVNVVDLDGNVIGSLRTQFKSAGEPEWDISEDENWTAYNKMVWHELFHNMQLDPTAVTYGTNRTFARLPWARGYDSWDEAFYEIRLQEQANGTYQVQLPHVWLLDYSGTPGYVFNVVASEEEKRVLVPASHAFTLTNYPFYDIPVEKSWHASVAPTEIPDSVTVYLLRDGERVKDENGKDLFLVLRKEDGWRGRFEKLPPLSVIAGLYALEEEAPGFIAIPGEKSEQTIDLVFDRAHSRVIDGRSYDLRQAYTVDENFSLNLRISVDGGDFIFGEPLRATEYTGCDQNDNCFTYYDIASGASLITIRNIPVALKNQGFHIAYYLDDGNLFHANQAMYDLYLNKGEDGMYTLYLPKVLPSGSSRDIFILKDIAYHGDYAYTLTNVKEPTHHIAIEKVWAVDPDDGDKVPEQLVITLTDRYGKVQTVTLTANEEEALDWKAVLESLAGYYALKGYTITEALIGDFEQVQKWERLLLAVTPHFEADATRNIRVELPDGTSLDGLAGVFDDTRLSDILLTGNYRYAPHADVATGDLVIRIEALPDGSYVIHYPAQLALTERLQVGFENRLKPEPPPDTPPDNPPDNPPDTPEEPPDTPEEPPVIPPDTPEEPPDTPEEPPVIPPDTPEAPPEIPEEPPVIPPDTPEEPEVVPPPAPEEPPSLPPETPVGPPPAQPTPPVQPGAAPMTHDPGVAQYMLLALICLLALARLQRYASHLNG